ncbi:hypothetical protein [Bradyrhizobium sp. Arg816]|uniref:hypothetical protein n=1 Tax=Bradyrhizobium sp. Arg816 TaxID=2998491 RepID=UPI00249EE438|nr:hypothetical protein [Bradyrhizobium sp. Arg816]MDI3561132.1 hypothetical protein [Bradyrhizobium sp. Arg816]
MTKRGWKRSPESKARMAELMRSRRFEISKRTKERMADPEVRQRIRDGMQASSGEAAELQMLRLAWVGARPSARTRFLIELTKAEGDQP